MSFASASTTEVQPLVFLEAMALSLPAVGVNAGGVPEIVRAQRRQCVYRRAANPRARPLHGHVAVRRRTARKMGEYARESVRTYDAERVVKDFERVYMSVISSCPPPCPSGDL